MQQTYLLNKNQTLSLNAALSGLWHHGLTGSSPRLLQSAKSSRRSSNLRELFLFSVAADKKALQARESMKLSEGTVPLEMRE